MASSSTRTRHKRRVAILVVLSMLNAFCATIDRGENRAIISVNGETGASVDKDTYYGCDGPESDHQSHRQVSGTVSARFEHRHGALVQLDGGAVRGSLESAEGFEPERDSYWLGLLGLRLGFDGKYTGFDIGGFGAGGTNISGFLIFNWRLGHLEYAWFELGTDVTNGRLGGPSFQLGIGFTSKYVSGHLGYKPVGTLRPVLTLSPDDTEGVTMEPDRSGQAFYSTVDIRFTGNFGIHVGCVLGSEMSAHMGLSLYL